MTPPARAAGAASRQAARTRRPGCSKRFAKEIKQAFITESFWVTGTGTTSDTSLLASPSGKGNHKTRGKNTYPTDLLFLGAVEAEAVGDGCVEEVEGAAGVGG